MMTTFNEVSLVSSAASIWSTSKTVTILIEQCVCLFMCLSAGLTAQLQLDILFGQGFFCLPTEMYEPVCSTPQYHSQLLETVRL